MMNDTRICYLTYGEPVFSPLLQTQVADVLKALVPMSGPPITWIAFVSPTDIIFQRDEVQRFQADLRKSGINLYLYTMPIVYSRLFLPRLWLWPLLSILGNLALSYHFRRYGVPKLIHARGYMATWLAVTAKRYAPGIRLIFDPRSLFPEENVTAGNWTENSLSFLLWKRLEKLMVERADVVIGVSSGFRRIFRETPEIITRLIVIPCAVDNTRFDQVLSMHTEIRNQLGLPSDCLLVVYSGSLGRWNPPRTIARYFACIWRADPQSRLVVLTKGRTDHLVQALQWQRVPFEAFRIVNANIDQVPLYLKASDIGLQVMEATLDSDTRLGVKFVEYMAAGLPVIVNTHAGAARDYVREYGVGLVVDKPEQEMVAAIEYIQKNKGIMSERCRDLARSFGVDSVASQYARLYLNLL